MRRLTAGALLLGLALFTALLVWQGLPAFEALYERAGVGVAWLAIYYIAPLACATASWRCLFAPGRSPGWWLAAHASWVGLAVNWLLPVAQVGGELVKAWMLVWRGMSNESALASVVVDKTLQVSTQLVFTLVGVALLVTQYTRDGLIVGIIVGAGFLAVLILLFYRLQRRGMFAMIARMVERFVSAARAERLKADARRVDDEVVASYQRRLRLAAAFVLRLLFRVVLVGEVMLAAWMLGLEVGLLEALIIESLVQAVRASAFAIPGGLGAQDGALVFLGVALGLTPEGALAIALAKRGRELLVGLPALGVWQVECSRRAVVP